MNTQGMTMQGHVAPWARGSDMKEVGDMPTVKHTIFTPEEREELISIMIDAYKRLQDPDCPL